MIRRIVLFVLSAACAVSALVALLSLCLLVAGTRWSLLIAVPAVAAAWKLDLTDRKGTWR